MDERRLQFKVISELMQYPDEGFMKRLPDVEVAVAELPEELRKKIEAFISFIKSQSPIRLQETYTAAFYMNSKTTLNMAYHQWGNSEKRALALAGLEQIYRRGRLREGRRGAARFFASDAGISFDQPGRARDRACAAVPLRF